MNKLAPRGSVIGFWIVLFVASPACDARAANLPGGVLGSRHDPPVTNLTWPDDDRQPAGEDFFDRYRSYEEHRDFMERLAASYPELAELVDLGPTVEGRRQWALHIRHGNDEDPVVFLQGAQHGWDGLGPGVVAHMAGVLLTKHGTDPQVKMLVENLDWYLLPLSNPDAYERREFDNANGVDLNTDWGGPGSHEAPFSQPETANIRDFVLAHPRILLHVDFHAYRDFVLWPWGHRYDDIPESPIYERLTQRMTDLIREHRGTRYEQGGSIYKRNGPTQGSATDCFYGVWGAWSWLFPLQGAYFPPPGEIRPTCEEISPALLQLARDLSDCNGNEWADWKEIAIQPELDCNSDGLLDVCYSNTDCNGNGSEDLCDISLGVSDDCNGNAWPDECDRKTRQSRDSNGNGLLDECETCVVRLEASDAQCEDGFGLSVDLEGNVAVMGAPDEDGAGQDAGAAYVFTFINNVWVEAGKLLAADLTPQDHFGFSVAVGKDLIVIGAPWDDDVCPDDPYYCNSGAVYVFTYDGRAWRQSAKLAAPDAQPSDLFGNCVAVEGNRVAVGARSAKVLCGDGQMCSGGAAYVFAPREGEWVCDAKVTARTPGEQDKFGWSVDLHNDVLLVGAPGDDAGPHRNGGAAFVFRYAEGQWQYDEKLVSEDTEASDHYGTSVAVSNEWAVVSPRAGDDGNRAAMFEYNGRSFSFHSTLQRHDRFNVDSYGSVAIEGDDIILGGTGTADGFHLEAGQWRPLFHWEPPDLRGDLQLGESVALSQRRALLGAPGEWRQLHPGLAIIADIEPIRCGGGEVLRARCIPDSSNYGTLIVRVKKGLPSRVLELVVDGRMYDLMLDCSGFGLRRIENISRRPHAIAIPECDLEISLDCS